MKSFLSVAVPVVLLMGGVAIVAFMTQNTGRSKTELPTIENPNPITTEGDPITFDDDTIDVDGKPMEVEYPSHPHKDFWFHTKQERDALIGLWFKSCGCADVQIGDFGMSDAEYQELAAAPTLTGLCRLMDTLSLSDMPEVKQQKSATIKATPAGRVPRPYVMRVHWDVKKTPQEAKGTERIRVEVNASLRDGVAQNFAREVEYVIVPASGFWPGNVELGEITPGGNGTRDCIVWSATRENLNLSMRITSGGEGGGIEPCAEISTPEKMSERELVDLPKMMGVDQQKIKPKSAYKFRVTLHERRGEHQLEMGPLTRKLSIKFLTQPGEPSLAPLPGTIAAIVRGEVSVLNGDDVGRVNLGTFRFDRPRVVDVRLGSTDPKLELAVESSSHEKMRPTLGEPKMVEGRREWVMRVELEASAFIGNFSQQIIIRVNGPNGRKLRIPVTGSAERGG